MSKDDLQENHKGMSNLLKYKANTYFWTPTYFMGHRRNRDLLSKYNNNVSSFKNNNTNLENTRG